MLETLQGQEKYLYTLEHRALPAVLFAQTQDTIGTILQSQGACFTAWMQSIQADMGEENPVPYQETEFTIQPFAVSSKQGGEPDIGIIQVNLPQAEGCTLCPRIYICHDTELLRPKYYTIENDATGFHVMCGWDKDNNHFNYGPAGDSEKDEFYKILGMYMRFLQDEAE